MDFPSPQPGCRPEGPCRRPGHTGRPTLDLPAPQPGCRHVRGLVDEQGIPVGPLWMSHRRSRVSSRGALSRRRASGRPTVDLPGRSPGVVTGGPVELPGIPVGPHLDLPAPQPGCRHEGPCRRTGHTGRPTLGSPSAAARVSARGASSTDWGVDVGPRWRSQRRSPGVVTRGLVDGLGILVGPPWISQRRSPGVVTRGLVERTGRRRRPTLDLPAPQPGCRHEGPRRRPGRRRRPPLDLPAPLLA